MYDSPLSYILGSDKALITLQSYMLYRVIRALLLKGFPKKVILFSLRVVHFDYNRNLYIHL